MPAKDELRAISRATAEVAGEMSRQLENKGLLVSQTDSWIDRLLDAANNLKRLKDRYLTRRD